MKPPLYAKGNIASLRRIKSLRLQAQRDKAVRVMVRLDAIMLSVQGHTNGEIAQLLQSDRSRVHAWVCAWNQHGVKGLLEGHRSGRPQRLTPSQIEHIKDVLESGPVAYGLNTGIWTSPVMADIISEECGVQYHPGHVRRLLSDWGFSVQQPTTRLAQADPVKRNRWIRYDRPCLKKKHSRKVPSSSMKMKPPSGKRLLCIARGPSEDISH
jgi:transposase